jgi:hypothetical protein
VRRTGPPYQPIGDRDGSTPSRKHGVQDDGKVLCLGPDRTGDLLEVADVARIDGSEIVIHAMRTHRIYEPLLRG